MKKAVLLLAAFGWLRPDAAAAQEYLEQVSLDSLLQIEVSAASRYAQRMANSPAVVTIVTAEEIRRFGDRTLDQLLARLAGFYTSYDRNYSYVGVRGFSRPTDYNNRLLLLLNGRSLNEPFYGMAPLGTDLPLDLGAVDRVEVVRGSSSALWGGGAMLAVINIVTHAGADRAGAFGGVELGTGGTKEARFGAGGTVAGVEAMVSLRYGDVAGEDLYFPEFDDPSSNHGRAERLDWDRYGSGLAVLGWRGLRAQLYASDRRKGIPTASWGASFNDPRAETRDRYALAELTYEAQPADRLTLSASAFAGAYHYAGVYPADGVAYLDATDTRSLGASAQAAWDVHASNRLLVGGEWSRHPRADYRSWSDADEIFFAGDYPYATNALFVQDEQNLGERATLTVGLRRDAHAGGHAAWNPRLAVVVRPDEATTVRALWGEAFRPPSAYEREFESDDFARSEALVPEWIRTAELALDRRIGRSAYARASVFQYAMRDLIDTVEDGDGVSSFRNVSRVAALGAELDVTAELGRVAAYARFTGVRVRDAEERGLSNAPRHLLKLGLSSPLLARTTLAADVQYGSPRTTVQGTVLRETLVANLVWRARELLPGLDVGLRVRNALDASYATPAGTEHVQAGIRQDGRRAYLFLEYRAR